MTRAPGRRDHNRGRDDWSESGPAEGASDLLADLEGRLADSGVVEGLRDPHLLELVEQLWTGARDEDGAIPLAVADAVARFYWLRHRLLVPTDPEDLAYALGIYSMIGDADPDAVPAEVRAALLAAGAPATTPTVMDWQGRLELAEDLLAQARSSGDAIALDEAITMFRALLEDWGSASVWDDYRPAVISNLSLALRLRADRTGRRDDLDEATELALAALDRDVPESDQAPVTANAAVALATRFGWLGRRVDFDAAVTLGAQALELTEPSVPAWPGRASDLSGMFRLRFDRYADPDDLFRATTLAREAAERTPLSVPQAGLRWSNVSNALAARYDLDRRPEDLDEAVDAGRVAVQHTSTDDPAYGPVVTNVANLLLSRYEHWHERQDLDDGIGLAQDAVSAADLGGRMRAGIVSNLANAHRLRYEELGELPDLEQALSMSASALTLTDDSDLHVSTRLANRAMILLAAYERNGDADLLQESFLTGLAARDAEPAAGSRRSKFSSNLAVILAHRAAAATDGSARRALLADASTASEEAVAALPAGHPDSAIRLMNLAGTFLDRARITQDPDDRQRAVDAYRRAAAVRTAPTSIRVQAARRQGFTAAVSADWTVAQEGYATAIQLMGPLISRQLTRRSREELLARVGLLAGDAAGSSLETEDRDRALQLLEQGRGVLWSQLLDTVGVSTIRARRPDLADRLAEIGARLR